MRAIILAAGQGRALEYRFLVLWHDKGEAGVDHAHGDLPVADTLLVHGATSRLPNPKEMAIRSAENNGRPPQAAFLFSRTTAS